jgi:hypothetical protein
VPRKIFRCVCLLPKRFNCLAFYRLVCSLFEMSWNPPPICVRCSIGSRFQFWIPTFRMLKFWPSLVQISFVRMSICSNGHLFGMLKCRTDTFLTRSIVKHSTKFRTVNFLTYYNSNIYFQAWPHPIWLFFLVTNIPLGAYLLRLGVPFWAQLG